MQIMQCQEQTKPCVLAIAHELNYLHRIILAALPVADDVNVKWDSLATEASVVALMAGAGTVVGHQLTTDCSRLQKQGESLAKMIWGSHLNVSFRSTSSVNRAVIVNCQSHVEANSYNDNNITREGGNSSNSRNIDTDRFDDDSKKHDTQKTSSQFSSSNVSPKYHHRATARKECSDEIRSSGASRIFPDQWEFVSQQFTDRTIRLPIASLHTDSYRYQSTTSIVDIKCPTIQQNPNCHCYSLMESSYIH